MASPRPKAESLDCDECGQTHRDGDKVDVIRTSAFISVACHKHAIWVNRHAIRELLKAWNTRAAKEG